jgi:hypothetical protein
VDRYALRYAGLAAADSVLVAASPGLGVVLGARVLAEKIVLARYLHNDRLVDALNGQAIAALIASPGARGYHDQQRARGVSHHPALRQLGNRLVGILHGCLKSGTGYDDNTAWAHGSANNSRPQLDNKAHGMSVSVLSTATPQIDQDSRSASHRAAASVTAVDIPPGRPLGSRGGPSSGRSH